MRNNIKYAFALFFIALLSSSVWANTVAIIGSMEVIASTTTSTSTTSTSTSTTTIPSIGVPSINPLNPTIFHDIGVIFTSVWSASLGPYVAKLYTSGSPTCNQGSNLVQTLVVSGNFVAFDQVYPTSYSPYYCIFVTDYKPATTNSINSYIAFNPKALPIRPILPWPWRNNPGQP